MTPRRYTFDELQSAWPTLRDALKPPPPRTSAPPPVADGNRSAYAQAALNGEAQAVREARNGARNTILNRSAFNLGTLIGAGIITEDDAKQTLLHAVSEQHDPLDEEEARGVIERGIAAGKRNPRSIA